MMLKDGEGGLSAFAVRFLWYGVLQCCMIGAGVWRHQDSKNILLTRRRIYDNILLDF